jgi:hypothetical protein
MNSGDVPPYADSEIVMGPEFGSADYKCAVVCGGLELLLKAIHADDPKREILVRIGDLMRDMKKVRAVVAGSRHD